MKDLISVIVPIYNVEAYLDECIESICNQTYDKLEIIMIDDGSTDKSGVIADKWELADKRCKVFHKNNEGLSAARNEGIKKAKGNYLVFIDSDDLIEKNMIERLYEEAVQEQVDMVCCGIKRRCDDMDYVKEYQVPSKIYTLSDYLYEMYSEENGSGDIDMFLPLVVAWNKIYKASLFENIKYPEGKICEDNAIIHRIVHTAGKVKWLNEPLYIYRQRQGSIMKNSFSAKRMDDFYAQLDRLHFMEDKVENQKLMDMMTVRCLSSAREYWCKIKMLKLWTQQQSKKVFFDIKIAYKKFVNESTFSFGKKISWFLFLHMRTVYYLLWKIIRKA